MHGFSQDIAPEGLNQYSVQRHESIGNGNDRLSFYTRYYGLGFFPPAPVHYIISRLQHIEAPSLLACKVRLIRNVALV